MTPAEHYRAAERNLEAAEKSDQAGLYHDGGRYLTRAQVHATLATVRTTDEYERPKINLARALLMHHFTPHPDDGNCAVCGWGESYELHA